MTKMTTGTYATLVSLNTAADNPTTIASTGLLTDGLSVSFTGLTVVNAGTIIVGNTEQRGRYPGSRRQRHQPKRRRDQRA